MAAKQLPENRVQSMVTMLVIVFALTMGLFYLWKVRTMPTRVIAVKDEIQLPPSRPVPPVNDSPRDACAHVGGTWADCGSPCHGSPPGTACAQACEPQCLCAGKNVWSCPAGQACQQKDAAGVGVCRAGSAPTSAVPVAEVPKPPVKAPAGMTCDATNSICVSTMLSGALLPNPFTVTGTAIAFENTANWRLLDANGKTLEEGSMMTDAPDAGKSGMFSVRQFLLHVPTTKTGSLEVFEASAKDGSAIHVVKLPVKLPQETMKTKVAWYAEETKPGSQWPELLTVTVPKTALPIETALRATLGLTPLEGYKTVCTMQSCPLKSLVVKEGVATVDFASHDDSIPAGIWQDQIRYLLQSFPSVKMVHVQVNGQE